MSDIRVIAFDFDGTLVDSNRIKRKGFDVIFASLPGGLEAVATVIGQDRKAVRREVITRTLQVLHPNRRLPEEQEVADYSERYNRYCIDAVSTCSPMPGVEEALPRLAEKNVLYINTATAEEAMGALLQSRGWTSYFRAALGFPPSKYENLRKILSRESLNPENLLMVGDDEQDLQAARECGCSFVAMQSSTSYFLSKPEYCVETLTALEVQFAGQDEGVSPPCFRKREF